MKIAFVTTGADNYFSAEYKVHERALAALAALEKNIGFELLDIPDEIRTAEHFDKVRQLLLSADMLLIQCGGFTDGTLVPLFAALEKPMCIWSVEEPTAQGDIRLHSLVTQNLYFSVLKKYCGSRARAYPLNGCCDMSDCADSFLDILAVEELCQRLQGGRICQIGNEAYGFLNLQEDESLLRERFGLTVEHMEVSRLVEMANSYGAEEVTAVVKRVLSETVSTLSAEALESSARIYLALRDIAAEGYLGLAVSCWPELQDEYNMVPCAAFSWLVEYNDIPISCEGDIGGVLSMIILRQLTASKPTLLDLTQYSREKDAILFWHCGFTPASYAEDKCLLVKHPMLNRRLGDDKRVGASQDFCFHKGDVTVLRVTGRDMALFAAEAQVNNEVSTSFTGTRAWLTDFELWGKAVSAENIINTLMRRGVEHHYALCFGKAAKRLRLYADINNYEVVE